MANNPQNPRDLEKCFEEHDPLSRPHDGGRRLKLLPTTLKNVAGHALFALIASVVAVLFVFVWKFGMNRTFDTLRSIKSFREMYLFLFATTGVEYFTVTLSFSMIFTPTRTRVIELTRQSVIFIVVSYLVWIGFTYLGSNLSIEVLGPVPYSALREIALARLHWNFFTPWRSPGVLFGLDGMKQVAFCWVIVPVETLLISNIAIKFIRALRPLSVRTP